tara:strand:+ start:438 stop:593 length:156 start_codon:yes stop_codon:yes gene_type:complete
MTKVTISKIAMSWPILNAKNAMAEGIPRDVVMQECRKTNNTEEELVEVGLS